MRRTGLALLTLGGAVGWAALASGEAPVRPQAAAPVRPPASAPAAAPAPAPAPDAPEAITRPSADRILAFLPAGCVAEVFVKEGDTVKERDPLARLDDEVERLRLAELKAQAEDPTRLLAAEAQLDQKRADLKKIEWVAQEGAATQWEVEHARLEVTIGELSVRLTKFNQQQDKLKYDQAVAQQERMTLRSPVAGKVEHVFLREGESAGAQEKVVRVVRIDPLWADVPVPLALARRLKAGQPARVRYLDGEGSAAEAKVLFIAAVADAASETLTVRLEVPNPTGRPAGDRVRVEFAPAAPAATPAP